MKSMLTEIPKSICIRLTRACNVACAFCQAPPTSRNELELSDIRGISKFFAARGVQSIKLSGGEPTVREDLSEVVYEIASTGIKPVVTTNGFRLSDSVLGSCSEHGGEFKFSIHRPSAENDTVLRRESFSEITRNLSRVAARRIRFGINTVVTPTSLGFMEGMANFAHQVGASKISFIPVVSRGRAKRGDQFDFQDCTLKELHHHVKELSSSYQGKLQVSCIDIRNNDYWVVENDGSLWIERDTEENDLRVCGKEDYSTFFK